MYDGSDTVSIISTDDDQWGAQIGAYNENSSQFPPPAVGLMVDMNTVAAAETVGKAELEAMLEAGWDDRPSGPDVALDATVVPEQPLSAVQRAAISTFRRRAGRSIRPLRATATTIHGVFACLLGSAPLRRQERRSATAQRPPSVMIIERTPRNVAPPLRLGRVQTDMGP